MRIANVGKIVSKETRLKQSNAKKGIKQSQDLVLKRAASHKGMKRPQDFCNKRKGSGNPNSTSVTVNGVFYNCKTDAVKALGITRYTLEKMISGN